MAMSIREITKLLPEYNGKEKTLDSFIKKIDKLWNYIAEFDENDRTQFLLVLQLKLTEKAAEAVQENEFKNWEPIKNDLRKHIMPFYDTEIAEMKLCAIMQSPKEDLEAYAQKVRNALDILNRSFAPQHRSEIIKKRNDGIAKKVFENGLRDDRLRKEAIERNWKTLSEVINYVIKLELRYAELYDNCCHSYERNDQIIPEYRPQKITNSVSYPKSNTHHIKKSTCLKYKAERHSSNEFKLEPPRLTTYFPVNIPLNNVSSDISVSAELEISKFPITNFLIDTGASSSLIKYETIEKGTLVTKDNTKIYGVVNNEHVTALAIVTTTIHFKKIGLEQTFYILPDDINIPYNGILGADFLRAYNANINYAKSNLSLQLKVDIERKEQKNASTNTYGQKQASYINLPCTLKRKITHIPVENQIEDPSSNTLKGFSQTETSELGREDISNFEGRCPELKITCLRSQKEIKGSNKENSTNSEVRCPEMKITFPQSHKKIRGSNGKSPLNSEVRCPELKIFNPQSLKKVSGLNRKNNSNSEVRCPEIHKSKQNKKIFKKSLIRTQVYRKFTDSQSSIMKKPKLNFNIFSRIENKFKNHISYKTSSNLRKAPTSRTVINYKYRKKEMESDK